MSTHEPLSSTNDVDPDLAGKRLLILGAGLWQVPYILRARALGVETWATDWSPTAVGRDAPHHFSPIDLRDRERTLEYAREARVDGVMTAADIGVPTAAYVAERLGLPGPGPRLAEAATNKRVMRDRALAAGLECPAFRAVRSTGAARTFDGDLPVIVKPTDSCSSRGVTFVDNAHAVGPAVEEALAASTGSGEALIEEFLRGVEGSVEALVQDGVVTIFGVCDKTKSPLPHRYDLELRYPGYYSADRCRAIEEFVLRLVRGFDIVDAMLHVEFLLDEHGTVYLLEFAIRGCGSKVVTHLLPRLTGVDVVRAIIRQALGLRTPIPKPETRDGALHFLMFPAGRVAAVHGVAEAQRLPGVIDACVERAPGDTIGVIRDGRSRPGHVLVCGRSRDDVQAILRDVHATIRVEYDTGVLSAPLDLGTWTYA